MAVILTQAVYNEPYGYEFSSSRRRFHGSLTIAAGSYVAGGLLPNWDSATFVLNPTKNNAGVNVLAAGYTKPTVLSPRLSALTTNVVTFTVGNALIAGQYVTFNNLTNLPFLNGLTLKVATVSSTTFTVAFTHVNVTSAAENGNAAVVIGPDTEWIQSIGASGFIYQYNKTFGTIQIFTSGGAAQAALVEFAAGALTTQVGDVVEFEAEYVSQ